MVFANPVLQMNVQLVPPLEPLIANMPSGREYHTPKKYEPPTLDETTIMTMRGPPDPSELDRARAGGEHSDDEGDNRGDPVGAFPGTKSEYVSSSSSYY